MRKLEMAEQDYLDDAGKFDTSRHPDCDIWSVRTFAAAAGFTDAAHFRDIVLTDPSSPFHCHKLPLTDAATGRRLGEILATHQNSAEFGGQRWWETQRAAARERGTCFRTLASSGP